MAIWIGESGHGAGVGSDPGGYESGGREADLLGSDLDCYRGLLLIIYSHMRIYHSSDFNDVPNVFF